MTEKKREQDTAEGRAARTRHFEEERGGKKKRSVKQS
jgi:hypothetical protein